jgi:hypothetical protein
VSQTVQALLVFTKQPKPADVGEVLSSVEVEIRDGANHRVTNATNAVTLTIGANPGGAQLTGGGPVNAVGGVATFDNLQLDQAANHYTLMASGAGLVDDVSAQFDIHQAGTRTDITSDGPDPSAIGQPYTVAFTVSVTGMGSGTPTGLVTVDDGNVSCQASVAAGSCQLISTVTGNRDVQASYAGDNNFKNSSSPNEKHLTNAFGPVDPGSSTATVPDGTAGNQTTITIQGFDQFGNAVAVGGATVQVLVSGANNDTAVVTDNDDGTYTAVYTPANAGVDTIDITLNGTAIQGSPYPSTVQ